MAAAPPAPPKRVLVSGCFDLLHSGHVEFFQQAATYGDLYVRLGTDANIRALKDHATMYSDAEVGRSLARSIDRWGARSKNRPIDRI